jgi:hypothetical protein
MAWPDAWQQVHICVIDRQVTDLAWKITHRVLYSAAQVHMDTTCFWGHSREDITHLSYGCPSAQSAVAWVSSNIHQGFPDATDITACSALYGFTRQECVLRVYQCIWSVCVFVYELKSPTANNLHLLKNFRFLSTKVLVSVSLYFKVILPAITYALVVYTICNTLEMSRRVLGSTLFENTKARRSVEGSSEAYFSKLRVSQKNSKLLCSVRYNKNWSRRHFQITSGLTVLVRG